MKYICLKNALKKYFSYPLYFLGEILGSLVFPIIINGTFLISIMSGKQIYDKYSLLLYIIISNVTFILSETNITSEIGHDIKSYQLGKKLLYPQNYIKLTIIESAISILVRIIVIYFPAVLVCLFIFKINIIEISFFQYLIVLLLACLLNISISLCVAFTAFFLTEIWGINAIKSFVFYTFSGALFPFDILPLNMQRDIFFLPFPYISYFPTKILTDQSFHIKSAYIIICGIWVLFFSVTAFFLWEKGVSRYESCGV